MGCFAALLALDRSGFAPRPETPGSGGWFLGVLLLAFVALWWGLRWTRRSGRRAATGADLPPLPVTGILAIALLLRLLALPLQPSLSDDVYRYLWDGRVILAGQNPYLAPPDDPGLSHLRDDLWRLTAHRDIATVYPPLALGVYAAASATPAPLFAYKAALATVDLFACALLFGLARRRGDPNAALAYAWNPLLIVEGAGMGHVDVLGASLVIVSVHLLATPGQRGRRPRRALAAGGATALGVLAKLVPAVAVPFWWQQAKSNLRASRPFAVGFCCLVLPAMLGVGWWSSGVPPGLVDYAVRWEYNGPLYEPLWRVISALRIDLAATGVVHVARVLEGGDIDGTPWRALYGFAYPQFLARIALLGAAVVLWLRLWRRGTGLVVGTFAVLGILLLASPTFYPWYLLWVLPWAALLGIRSVLLLSATLTFAYLPATAGAEYFPWTYGAVWLPPLCMFLLDRRRRRSGHVPSPSPDPEGPTANAP